METIHKKNGRLHIYVRQDKYKGELKSHNWVGRTYINGKQKVISSGTTNLEEAIPILEKWYDDLQVSAQGKDQPLTESQPPKGEEGASKTVDPPPKIVEEKISSTPTQPEKAEIAPTQNPQQSTEKTKSSSSIFEKIKNIKISKPSFGKKTPASEGSKIKKTSKFAQNLQGFFKSKVSKMSVAGEEIVGVDITNQAVRVAQVSKDKNENWILDKFSYRLLDQEKISENLIDHKDYLSEEIKLALANGKITSTNVALSIPVTSAIIRVVTSPLMTEEELTSHMESIDLIDFEIIEGGCILFTNPSQLFEVKKYLEDKSIKVESEEIAMDPITLINIDNDQQTKINNLSDKLEEIDDVQNIYMNVNLS
mgnify:CR=1 FL=1